MLGGVGLAPKIHGPTLRVLTLSSGSPRAADCALFAIFGRHFHGPTRAISRSAYLLLFCLGFLKMFSTLIVSVSFLV